MDHGYDLLLLENQVCFPAYAVANKILRRYQPLLKKLDLTYTQYVTMMVLWEKGTAHEKDLVKALYLQANTLTDLLKNLKKKGYIDIRKDDKDRRNIEITLTEEGGKLKDSALCVPKTLADEHWLTDEEFKTFKGLLYKLLEGDWGK
ncbi:MAG: MarR family transcriptional regulator [Clostridia bacterium]|nr:MarR family transcriptional regulator [Clostridia bacterium]MBP5194115.1 MarR family transcriptional regulator [Clostridia bacterium]